jgi:hypothetical protein
LEPVDAEIPLILATSRILCPKHPAPAPIVGHFSMGSIMGRIFRMTSRSLQLEPPDVDPDEGSPHGREIEMTDAPPHSNPVGPPKLEIRRGPRSDLAEGMKGQNPFQDARTHSETDSPETYGENPTLLAGHMHNYAGETKNTAWDAYKRVQCVLTKERSLRRKAQKELEDMNLEFARERFLRDQVERDTRKMETTSSGHE